MLKRNKYFLYCEGEESAFETLLPCCSNCWVEQVKSVDIFKKVAYDEYRRESAMDS